MFPSDQRRALQRVSDVYARIGFAVTRNDGSGPPESLVGERGPFAPRLAVRVGTVPVLLIEVETAESLERDALSRWKEASGWNLPLLVYVPDTSYGRADELMKQHRLQDATLLCYGETEAANIVHNPGAAISL